MSSLQGKTALVTGASSGIGRAIATLFPAGPIRPIQSRHTLCMAHIA